MRSYTVTSLFACVVVSCWLGQTADEELLRLQKHLDVDEAITVHLGSPAYFGTAPVRAYLAVWLDLETRRNFVHWIDEWNKKDARRYGRIDLVPRLADAQVILARYTLSDRLSSVTDTSQSKAIDYNWNTNKLEEKSIARTYSIEVVPEFGYVILVKPGRLEVLSRYATTTPVAMRKNVGRRVWEEFKTTLKLSR